jgi:multidrug efflux system outer membrane protein
MRDPRPTRTRGALRRAKPSTAILTAFAASLSLGLAGCSIPKLREADAVQALPESFSPEMPATDQPPSSAQTSIKDFFGDPVLTDLIEQAFANNLELKILAEDVQIASNEVLARKGAYLPFIDFNGGASLTRSSEYTTDGAVEDQLELAPERSFADPLPGFLVAAEFSWELDIWKRLRNARDAATLRFLATNEGRNYVITRLVAEIAEAYYTLLALDSRLEVIDQAIELQHKSLEVAQAKKDAGRGTELAVQRFRAEVKQNQSERLIVQQEIVEAENRINRLVGRFPQPVERETRDFLSLSNDALSVGIPSELIENRPDIRRAELEVESTGYDVKAARAAYYPRLTLSGGVGYEANSARFMFQTPESLAANVAAGLVAPLINTNDIQAEYQTANARQLAAIYEYQRTVLTAFTEVVTRVSMVQNYRESIALKTEQLRSLEDSVTSAGRLFQNARAEYSEVLFAQRDLIEAKLVLIDLKREQLGAVVNAYQALGGGNVLSRPAVAEASTEATP